MDESLLKEIHYLTHLIEHHNKKSSGKVYCKEESIQNQNSGLTRSYKCTNLLQKCQLFSKTSDSISNTELTSTNVYINPNFKHQNSAIHINPSLRVKPLVHVNPKMVRGAINSNENIGCNSINKVASVKQISLQERNSMKKSVYVNPKLMKKLSSSIQSKPVEHASHPVCSRLKFVKDTNTSKTIGQKRTNNSNIVILSQRKLVRVKRVSRRSLSTSQMDLHKIKKSPNSSLKSIKPFSHKVMKTKIVNTLQQSVSKNTNFVKMPIIKPTVNKYRIDRTIPKSIGIKEHIDLGQKKIMNNKSELITIGGIVYKSSKNQLVRKSYGVKRKRATNTKDDKFIVTTNGKKLCRIRSLKQISGNSNTKTFNTLSGTKLLSNISQKVNYKNNISNKVKQRSIQILRNKMQKNNQPCLIFQRFGYCSNHERGICVKRHDKKQISLCKKFLQGNCLLDKCPLSHDVGPEKMPTCKYFLEGCCTRDDCPYRHIKVSSSTPICREFLQGYCAKGRECKQRHENLCPEFARLGTCSKGKHCPYPHKPHSPSNKQNHFKRKYNVPNDPITPPTISKNIPTSSNENRLRYYEQADSGTDKSLDEKRERVMNKIKLMKRVEATIHSDALIKISDDNINLKSINDNCESQSISDCKIAKRPPIGFLPTYIPIN
ncbi:zinc finger CCCH domain-containing protein 3 [Hylaeus anthracinus]|uniref:zinc finger CCCH domain-containing protein 3 n=1 Tax=Hylaeus anthracinus TaxID=313031 RepID=UPI0023B9BFE9|nr:zinc finger CCCH domain-containing protein 3 [Hylaeus anthracinus]